MSMGVQKRPAKRLWNLLQLDKQEIKNIYFFAVLSGLVSLSLPLGIQAIINFMQAGQISTSWTVLVVGVIAGVIITGLLQILQLRIMESMQQKIFIRNAFEFASLIPNANWKVYPGRITELMNRFLDTTSVQKGISKLVLDFSSASLQILFGLILLSFYHPVFVLMGLLFLVVFVLLFRYHFRDGLHTSLTESRNKYKMLAWLEEMAANIPMVKTNIHSDFHLQKTDKYVMNYLEAREQHFKVLRKNYFSLIAFKVFIISGLLIIGGLLVINQDMNMGQFIASEIIIILLMNSVEKLMHVLEVLYDVLTSLEKIGRVTDIEMENQTGLHFPALSKRSEFHIAIEESCFCQGLSSESMNIISGDRILIKGNKRKVKNVMEALGGLNKLSDEIRFNNIKLYDFNIAEYRRNVYFSRDKADVFEGTILENLTLNNKNHSLEDLNKAIDASGLSEYLPEIKGGLHHIIKPGSLLSDMELYMKIGLSRAILSDSPILLFNNSFMYLTQEDTDRYLNYLTKNIAGGCVVVFTDRIVNEKLFNKIIEIKE